MQICVRAMSNICDEIVYFMRLKCQTKRVVSNDLKKEQKSPTHVFSKKAIDTILEHIAAHGDYLWGHNISMLTPDGELVTRYIYRTNNILERFFRPVKRNIRRRIGCGDVGYSLEHTKASICYIVNLLSQKGCRYENNVLTRGKTACILQVETS